VTARFITEDTYRGKKNDPLSLNLYTYSVNNPIKYIDPSGHWTKEVHETKTEKWVKQELNAYIKNESKNIVVYKTDKKGNIINDKKGNPVIDTKKTEKERNAWVKEQTAKVDGYAKAIAAGDKYVDQEKTIFTRVNFAGDGIFHGLNGLSYTGNSNDKNNPYNFITERKNTVATILTSKSYEKTGAITKHIIDPAIDILDKKTTSKDTSKASIERDIADGKFINGSAYTNLTGKNATKEKAALFVLGMGLHSLQDIQAHGMQTTPHGPTDHNDDTTYDYNEKTGWVKGSTRIKNTETATRDYINDFLYGDSDNNIPGYGSFLFSPSKYSISKK
jgi:hypothetical protein